VTEAAVVASETAEPAGKRVSWVELYFDLIFVFAVGQVAHVMVERPEWHGVLIALGLFATLWWTWIGYVVLYNRSGEDRPIQRLFLIVGTVPCAIAATQAHGVAVDEVSGFALALAGARVVLAVAYPMVSPEIRAAGRTTGAAYAISAVALVVSAFIPPPWRYVVWGLVLANEAGFLLLAGRRDARDRRGYGRGREAAERRRADQQRALMTPPTEPGRAVDAAHLSERFSLFMIILLGEIVISVATAAVAEEHAVAGLRIGFLAGLVLAGALWWIYFDSSAGINEYVLRASGGNPAMAYGIYAGGHLPTAFALLLVAAGVNLSLHDDPSVAAAWLVSAGLAIYFVGTRGFTVAGEDRWYVRLLRPLAIAATVCLGLLHRVLSPTTVVVVAAVWAVGAAVIVSLRAPEVMRRLRENPLRLFGDR
jgi:low temperature requirement protein LtrA